jgi:hypothetical protein
MKNVVAVCTEPEAPRQKPAPRRDGGGSPGGSVSWRGANQTIGLGRPMDAGDVGDPEARAPIGCGIPKVPHRTFGAEEGHGSSGASGSRECRAARQCGVKTTRGPGPGFPPSRSEGGRFKGPGERGAEAPMPPGLAPEVPCQGFDTVAVDSAHPTAAFS